MAHTVDATARNPANAVRASLDELERRAVKPDASTVEAFLLQLDDVERSLAQLEADGMDVRPERVRWENVLRRLESQPRLIASAAAGAGGLKAMRTAHPPAAGFWWHADEARASRVRRALLQAGAVVAAVIAVLVAVWAVITYVFPPNPETVAVMGATSAIEQLIQNGQWDEALARARAEAAQRPENDELAMWVAVLSERAGVATPDTAAAVLLALHQADPMRYWLLRGEAGLRLDSQQMSLSAAAEALRLQPESPEASFLMGRAAFLAGDRDAALEHLGRAADLAQDVNPQLSVSARMLWAELVQQPVLPTPSTPPMPSTPATTP